jgi:hypothetical protein
MNDIALTIVGLLAQDRETGPEFGKASPFGLLVIALLLVGTFLLVWSMNRHLRKLPKSFDEPEEKDLDVPDAKGDGESQRESG